MIWNVPVGNLGQLTSLYSLTGFAHPQTIDGRNVGESADAVPALPSNKHKH